MLKRVLKLKQFGWLVLSLSLTACADKPNYKIRPVAPLTLAQQRSDYLYSLRQAHIPVIELGETFRFILFSQEAFYGNSANLQPDYRVALRTLAKFMRTYDKSTVSVLGYTDSHPSNRAQWLTERQAQTVANYLWDRGVDTRLMIAKGYGRYNQVGRRSDNQRVEVEFAFYENDNG